MNEIKKSKSPSEEKLYSAPSGIFKSSLFKPELETLDILKKYVENYKIIQVISKEHYPTTQTIAKRIGLSRERTLKLLKKFESVNLIQSKRDEKNRHHWSNTTYKGYPFIRLFREMCDVIENKVCFADEREITGCIRYIKDKKDNTRYYGLFMLQKMSAYNFIRHDSRILETLMEISRDPSYDKFKDDIISCLLLSLPTNLENDRELKKLDEIDIKELQSFISDKKIEELNSIIKQFYSDEMLKPLERYCFNEPISPTTIPLSLNLMRLINEELAIKNMIKILLEPPVPYDYTQILIPARGLSLPMKEKLQGLILDISLNHPKIDVRNRALVTHKFFIECSIGF